jgi:DNA invertase Pin-like site-specific DNA recombinase
MLIGYARVSTDEQDLTAQQDTLAALGVDRVYLDHGAPQLPGRLSPCRRR